MTPFDYIILVLALVMVYAWCIFPPVLSLIARTKSCHKVSADTAVPGEVPRVAVLIAAHNEEAVIRQRLENLFGLDYPAERMQVLIGVDGASDATASVARESAADQESVKLVEYEENRGKIAVLKDLVWLCVGGGEGEGGGESTPNAQRPTSDAQRVECGDACPELLVFTDANTHFRQDALRRLVGHFRDPGVGGVCGRLVFTSVDPHSVPEVDMANPSSEGFYWDWETRMKESESRLDSCLGANGGIYAIRPELFWSEI
ncbi:MAG: glycosyltransferase, partial [Kiritimatiellia bacterium]|nr:glycosyltransferase [Kiritimatiellia bacterium]